MTASLPDAAIDTSDEGRRLAGDSAGPERGVVFACVLGNALELYDFTTYTFFAVEIGGQAAAGRLKSFCFFFQKEALSCFL